MEKSTAKQLDITPFLALTLAGSPAARAEMDKIYAQGKIKPRSGSKKSKYECFYRERDVLACEYCRKAETLIAGCDDGKPEAEAVLEDILKKGWSNIWRYVQTAPEPLSFDSFCINKSLKQKRGQSVKRGAGLPPSGACQPKRPARAGSGEAGADFIVFGQAAALLKKAINWQEPFVQSAFNFYAQAYEDHKQPAPDPASFLSEKQKATAEELWQSVKKRLGGAPANLEEYFQTEEYRKNSAKKYFFYRELLDGLPVEAVKSAVVGKKHLRLAVDGIAARLPEDTEINDALRQTALDAVLYALIMRALVLQYEETAGYALKHLETGEEQTGENNEDDDS